MKRSDDGAAAVELALVLPILVLLLLSIMDYGVWYSDSIAVRQGTREGARQGVVGVFPSPCGSGTPAVKTACLVNDRAGTLNATLSVWVKAQGDTWKEGNQLTVCTRAQEDGLAGFAPLPANGQLRSKVVMRIEQTIAGAGSAPKPAGDWTWC